MMTHVQQTSSSDNISISQKENGVSSMTYK